MNKTDILVYNVHAYNTLFERTYVNIKH